MRDSVVALRVRTGSTIWYTRAILALYLKVSERGLLSSLSTSGNSEITHFHLIRPRTCQSGMITDARVLQPEFIPREVQHRDAEVNYLSSVLDPITHGERADPALLHGPSGAGKTCIAQFLVERLREEVMDINYQYVNCWERPLPLQSPLPPTRRD